MQIKSEYKHSALSVLKYYLRPLFRNAWSVLDYTVQHGQTKEKLHFSSQYAFNHAFCYSFSVLLQF